MYDYLDLKLTCFTLILIFSDSHCDIVRDVKQCSAGKRKRIYLHVELLPRPRIIGIWNVRTWPQY
jgi:hypothetical protein